MGMQYIKADTVWYHAVNMLIKGLVDRLAMASLGDDVKITLFLSTSSLLLWLRSK